MFVVMPIAAENSKQRPGSKYDNALKLGVKTINEDEFEKMTRK